MDGELFGVVQFEGGDFGDLSARTILNGDIKILGALLAFNGISRYVTTDEKFHTWAKSYLKVELLPNPPPEQVEMFG